MNTSNLVTRRFARSLGLALPMLALAGPGCALEDEALDAVDGEFEPEFRAEPNLVAHWSFDDCQGQSTVDDVSDSNRDLSLGAGASCATQGSNSTYYAGGSASTSTAQNSSNLNFQYEMTASLWIRPTVTSSSRKLIDRGAPFHITLENGKIIFHVMLADNNYYHINSNVTVPTNKWTMVTAVIVPWQQNRVMRLYINGKNVANTPIPYVPMKQTSNSWKVAKRINGYGFYGHLDEVRLYNRALSDAEISGLHAAGHEAPAYANFALSTATALYSTGGNWQLQVADNRDVFAIAKSQTGSGMTEVHVLSAASNYQSFSNHVATALHPVGDNWQLLVADNRDVFAIAKSQTGSGMTEVHVLSAASNYQSFSSHIATALGSVGDNFQFGLASNRDLFAITSSQTGSGSTEIHVLSAASNYQSFSLHTGTALPELGGEFEFEVAPNRDVYLIAKSPTGTGTTEVHALSAALGYQGFWLRSGTALGETGSNYEFGLADNLDLFAFKKSGGTKTRVEVLDESL